MPNSHVNSELCQFLGETMTAASAELIKRQGSVLKTSLKADTSLVTEADLASEKVILERLARYYPEDAVYSEEAGRSTNERKVGQAVWVVDPLDGTTNYANGYPFYCISIGRGRFTADGLIDMEEGAVYDVPRGRFYHAAKGRGATVDGKTLRVAPARDMVRAFLVTGFYYWKDDDLKSEIARFSRVAAICQSIRRDGAAALDLAMVAEGIFDGFWEMGLMPWDVAAGSLLVREAGGSVLNYPDLSLPANSARPVNLARYNIEGRGIIAGATTATAAISGAL